MQTPRLPAKGETLIASGYAAGPGGKGSNQAIGIARLGVPVTMLACVGTDAFGDEALELWRHEGVEASAVIRSSERPTMVGFIILDDEGDNRILIDPGANSMLLPQHVEAFGSAIRRSRVLQAQLETPVPTVDAALQIGREAGITTVLNPAPAQPLTAEVLSNVDVLTPNQSEARILTGLDADDPRPDEDVAARLLDIGVRSVIMTLGEDGALIATRNGSERVPGRTVDVVDTTGAGDSFNAALSASLAEGRPLREAVARANHAGALTVAAPGVVPALPTRDELEASLAADA